MPWRCARYHNFMHRHCDLIEIANRSNLMDSFCSGIIQTNNHALYKTPTYYVQELYATAGRTDPARDTRASGRPDARLPADLPDLGLDCSATLAADKSHLALMAVNHTNVAQERTVDLSAFDRPKRESTVFTVCGLAGSGRTRC